MKFQRMTYREARGVLKGEKAEVPATEKGSKPAKKPAHKAGEMNRLEAAYAMRLEALNRVGEIRSYEFEVLTFRLPGRVRYTPDFLVVAADGSIEMVEIKGPRVWEDSWIKFKQAAELFPWARWFWVTKVDGEWNIVQRA